MEQVTQVMEYKCPCCNAGLEFSGATQELTCPYCDNSFNLSTVKAYNEAQSAAPTESVTWDDAPQQQWAPAEQERLNAFQCPSCGGEILCEDTTAASFCPYCGNPTVMPTRLSGTIKPDSIIPFKKTRIDAENAFKDLCKQKKLLPKAFTSQQQLEKITGLYVPFWLYDCASDFDGTYKATRITTWSDSRYDYTRTSHYLVRRGCTAKFQGIPMDGSSKMDNTFMESIEPYDYEGLKPFTMAYLTGYLADMYDVPSDQGEPRIKERVDAAIHDELQSSLIGYHTVVPTSRNLQVSHSKARYVLLPVWTLTSKYGGQTYTFAMNGQTGKITGSFPICRKKSLGWFCGVTAAVAAVTHVLQWLVLM